MTPFDHIPLTEGGQILTVYADCIGGIEIIQPGSVNIRVTYVEMRKIGGVVYRVPVLEMIRPRIWSEARYWHLLMAQAQSEMGIAAH